jgi:prepilin-type N-terminal cleavage/methylation domain-containing protein
MGKSKVIINFNTKGGESKSGFTLLELMIVIIIMGILATIAMMQYHAAVEKSRSAEAKKIINTLRSICGAFYLDGNDVAACTDEKLSLGSGGMQTVNQLPGDTCWGSHYFRYDTNIISQSEIIFTATRCDAGGKEPDRTFGSGIVSLDVDYSNGKDEWNNTGGY